MRSRLDTKRTPGRFGDVFDTSVRWRGILQFFYSAALFDSAGKVGLLAPARRRRRPPRILCICIGDGAIPTAVNIFCVPYRCGGMHRPTRHRTCPFAHRAMIVKLDSGNMYTN